jgi:Mg-chelatase subunit ChlD
MHDPCGKFDNAKLSVGFTSHADQIQNALKAAQAGGLTAMLDAVNVAPKEMKYAKNPRKSIVIVSDGGGSFRRPLPSGTSGPHTARPCSGIRIGECSLHVPRGAAQAHFGASTKIEQAL